MRALVAGLFALTLPLPSIAVELQGIARVLDGDTIEIAGQHVQLHGIDAPELDQTCWVGQGVFPCGLHVKVRLEIDVAGQVIACEERNRDSYERIVAVCRGRDGTDLGRDLVRGGWAMAYRRHGQYVSEEAQARRLNRGLWVSLFTPPWIWRKMMRDAEEF